MKFLVAVLTTLLLCTPFARAEKPAEDYVLTQIADDFVPSRPDGEVLGPFDLFGSNTYTIISITTSPAGTAANCIIMTGRLTFQGFGGIVGDQAGECRVSLFESDPSLQYHVGFRDGEASLPELTIIVNGGTIFPSDIFLYLRP